MPTERRVAFLPLASHAYVELCLEFRLPPVKVPCERRTPTELHAILTYGLGKAASLDHPTVSPGQLRTLFESLL